MKAAILAGLILAVGACAPPPFACADQAILASVATQNRVINGMRDPASTRFDDAEMRATMESSAPCRWRTHGLGRSANGFGGISVFRYQARVDFSVDGKSWTVSEIKIAEAN